MKSLTTTFKTGDLRPRERMLLLAQNDVAKDTAGKETLTAAEVHALSEGWRPENNEQVHEFNRYFHAWRAVALVQIDAQIAFLNAQQSGHFRKQAFMVSLNFYPYYREMRALIRRIGETKRVDIHTAFEIAEKQKAVKMQNGLDFDYTVYQLAFERMSDEDRTEFIALYPDVKTDPAYLDQEEVIANLLNDEGELIRENKETLARLVAEKSYNAYAKKHQLYHYFACIPLAEVARRFLSGKGITVKGKPLSQDQEVDDEDDATHETVQEVVEKYAKENGISIQEMLKQSCLEWLDGDLFEQYMPLALSNSSELFIRWLTTKAEAKAEIQKLVTSDKLKIKKPKVEKSRVKVKKHLEMAAELLNIDTANDITDELEYPAPGDKIITGESLYSFDGNYGFVKDFKKDVDTYHANLGLVYADDDPEHQGKHLDREFLIANLTENSELSFFSMFGMETTRLGILFESNVFFKEVERDGDLFLEFKNKNYEKAFLETRDELMAGYAAMLWFDQLLERLSKVFEIDISYRTKKWLGALSGYIDAHNEALDRATGHDPDKGYTPIGVPRQILAIDRGFYIDKESIRPNKEDAALYLEKFEEVLSNDS